MLLGKGAKKHPFLRGTFWGYLGAQTGFRRGFRNVDKARGDMAIKQWGIWPNSRNGGSGRFWISTEIIQLLITEIIQFLIK